MLGIKIQSLSFVSVGIAAVACSPTAAQFGSASGSASQNALTQMNWTAAASAKAPALQITVQPPANVLAGLFDDAVLSVAVAPLNGLVYDRLAYAWYYIEQGTTRAVQLSNAKAPGATTAVVTLKGGQTVYNGVYYAVVQAFSGASVVAEVTSEKSNVTFKYTAATVGNAQVVLEDGTPGLSTVSEAATADASGNLYVLSLVSSNSNVSTAASFRGHAIEFQAQLFLSKYDATGAWKWSTPATYQGIGTGIALDASGKSVFIDGITNGSLGFFVQKFDAGTGASLAASSEEGVLSTRYALPFVASGGIAVDAAENVYVTGTTGTPLAKQKQNGSTDLFIAKFAGADLSLTKLVQDGVARGKTSGQGIAVDPSGYIYVTGSTNAGIDGSAYHAVASTLSDFFLTKYSSELAPIWTKEDGTRGKFAYGYSVAIDSSALVYVAGTTTGLDGKPATGGTQDLFLTKYDGAGNLLWTQEQGISGNVYGASQVVVDSTDNIYVVGSAVVANYPGTLPGARSLSVPVGTSAVVSRFNLEGDLFWNQLVTPNMEFNGYYNNTTFGPNYYALSLAVDSGKNVYLAGSTASPLVGALVNGKGLPDYFVAKFAQADYGTCIGLVSQPIAAVQSQAGFAYQASVTCASVGKPGANLLVGSCNLAPASAGEALPVATGTQFSVEDSDGSGVEYGCASNTPALMTFTLQCCQ